MADPVAAVPPEYAAAIPYLVVPDGAAALAFYTRAFGGIELYRLTGPGGVVMHAEMRIGAALFMLGSASPGTGFYPATHYGGTPVAVVVFVADVDDVVSHAIAAGGTVLRPLENHFYGDRAAVLADPFGLRWHFATHIEDVTPAEMQTRMEALFTAPA